MNAAGCQINLDHGEGQIADGVLIDDIRCPCSELQISFESPIKLTFTADNQCYFTFQNQDWVPASHKGALTQNGTYFYQISAFPKPYFDIINSPTFDTRSLAKSMNIELNKEGQSLEIKCPIVGLKGSQLVNEYRNQSYKEAYKQQDMGKAYLIYFDSKELLSVTFTKLINQNANSLQIPEYLQHSTITNYIDERIDSELRTFRKCGPWKQNDFLYKMFGKKFEIKSPSPASFLRMYTMKFDDSSEFDVDSSFLCIRSERTITEAGGFIHTFAEIKYVR